MPAQAGQAQSQMREREVDHQKLDDQRHVPPDFDEGPERPIQPPAAGQPPERHRQAEGDASAMLRIES